MEKKMKYPHLFSRIDMTNNLNFKFFKTYLKETNANIMGARLFARPASFAGDH
jgi:hypothetical protein